MRLAAHCSKMVNGYHKVGLAAVLSFCWILLHLEAEQQLSDTYDLEGYQVLYRGCIDAQKGEEQQRPTEEW